MNYTNALLQIVDIYFNVYIIYYSIFINIYYKKHTR